nr:HTTM domain-containing protein [Chitinophagales bacterium]
FTYVELLDKTNYLNHYYFISIISLLLCLLPATAKTAPRWAILTLQLQMGMVYFFAGVAKVNTDWLLNAMPLKVWLPSKTELPVIGGLLGEPWLAYVFSWCGMLFDISIAFFLFNRKTVWYAYAVVIIFHVLTAILFPGIGMFPFIMIVCATVFLPATFHQRILSALQFKPVSPFNTGSSSTVIIRQALQYTLVTILALHFSVQALLPFRYALYPNNLFYTEQGFRFSWRVMLMEKAGTVFFTFKNANGQMAEVNNREFLTAQQEKQMSTQPDMILQFAHYLKQHYNTNEVYAEAYVTVNGKGSRLFIDPKINLAQQQDNFKPKNWILARAD